MDRVKYIDHYHVIHGNLGADSLMTYNYYSDGELHTHISTFDAVCTSIIMVPLDDNKTVSII